LHTEAPNGFVDPLPAPTIDKPVQAAIGHYLKSAPRQVIRQAVSLATTAWSPLRGRGDAVARGDELIAPAGREAQGHLAVFVKSEPNFADEVRAWRDATKTRASVTALIMLSIYRALRDAGIPLAEVCEVLVDLRRFSAGRGTDPVELLHGCPGARGRRHFLRKTSAPNSARGPNRPGRS